MRGRYCSTLALTEPLYQEHATANFKLSSSRRDAVSILKICGVFAASVCAPFYELLNPLLLPTVNKSIAIAPSEERYSIHNAVTASAFVYFFYYSDKMQTVLAVFCVLNLYCISKPHYCI